MILDPIMALTKQYFAMRLALLVGMPINLNPLTNLQCPLPSEPTINTIILVTVFLGYCLAQREVTVKFTLVTIVLKDIERHGHLNNQTLSGRMINDA